MENLRAQCRQAAVSSKKLDRMFSVYDQDGSGSIAYDEVQGMVKEFHCEAVGKDAAAIVLDRFSPSGAMSYDQFCSKVVGLPQGSHVTKALDPEQERVNPRKLRERISDSIKGKIYRNPKAVKKAFVMFDKDFGGSVSWPEFRDGFKELGLPAARAQVKQLFDEYRPDTSGEIATKQFARGLLGLDEAGSRIGSRMGTGSPYARSLTPSMEYPAMMAPRQAATRGGSGGIGSRRRPTSSLDHLTALGSIRGASRLSIGPGMGQGEPGRGGSAPPMASSSPLSHGLDSGFLIRPNTGLKTEIVVHRKPGSNRGHRGSRHGSQSRGQSRPDTGFVGVEGIAQY